jgi:hypothetical protein
MFRPSPWTPFCIAVRLVCGVLAGAGLWAGGWGLVGVVVGAVDILRVPRRRLLLELAAAAAVLGAVVPQGLPLWLCAAAALLALPLAPEGGPLPLNGLDRYFVAQDYPGTPMNSHHFVDTVAPLDRASLEAALAALMAEVPMARSFVREAPLGVERFAARRPFVRAADLIVVARSPLEAEDARLLDAHFDLARVPPVRVVLAPRPGGGFRTCLTLHHSAADGEGGLVLLDRLLRRYREHREGRTPQSLPPLEATPRFRTLLRRQGLRWLARAVRRHVHPFGKVGAQHAHLLDDVEPRPTCSRHVTARVAPELLARLRRVAETAGVSRHDLFVSAALRAADARCRARGRPDRPFRVLLPTNLRRDLGMAAGLGNYVGTIKVHVEAAEVRRAELPGRVATMIRAGRLLEEAVETPVNLGVVSAVLPPWLLRRALRRLDADSDSFFFSFLFSTMRPPPELTLPEAEGVERVLVRGSLSRRPGFGLALTRFRDELAVVVEYLSPIVTDETARTFAAGFVAELERLGDVPAAAAGDQADSGLR